MMIVPPFLKPGDRIRIIAPAGKVQKDKVLPGIELLRDEGFEVITGRNVFNQQFQYAGDDKQRAFDLQEAIADPETKAIICARGGYGTVRLLESTDFSPLQKAPKWLAGFSDITVLHAVFNQLGLASIHGAMPGFFLENKKPTRSFFSLMELLRSGTSHITTPAHPLNRVGIATAELVGGNLSLINSLQGTPWQLNTDGKILLIEDVGEYLYHLDRMMQNLRLAGQLKNLAGLVVGGFTEMKDNESPYGKTVEEIIFESVSDYSFPVCFDLPVGHIPKNLSLMFGANYQLEVGESCRLSILKS